MACRLQRDKESPTESFIKDDLNKKLARVRKPATTRHLQIGEACELN